MRIVKITLSSGSDVFINVDSICDIRKDVMSDNHTLIQFPNTIHKVKLTIKEVLELIGAENVSYKL